jgi:hypothetical protein
VRIERVAYINQSADFFPLSGRSQRGKQQAGTAGGIRPANFGETSAEQAAGQRVDLSYSAGSCFRGRPYFEMGSLDYSR